VQQDLIRNAVKCVPRHAFYRYDAFWGRAVESTANTYLFQCVVFLTAFRREDGKPVKTCLVFFFFFSPGHCARAHCKNICFDRLRDQARNVAWCPGGKRGGDGGEVKKKKKRQGTFRAHRLTREPIYPCASRRAFPSYGASREESNATGPQPSAKPFAAGSQKR